jgi:tetratricopeptide (TPR) repeat protein
MMLYTGRRERGDMTGALEAVLMLKELGARDSDLLPHLDYLAKSMGRKPVAIPAYEAILEINPEDRDACVAMATIYANQGDFRQSDQYLDRAVALDPAAAPALYYNTAARLAAKKSPSAAQLQRAIDLLCKSIELQPNFVDAYKTLGFALNSTKQPSTARLQRVIDLLTRSIELQPDLADAYKTLGIAQWKAEDGPGAQKNLTRYLELNPDGDDRATVEKWLTRLSEG